MSIATRLMPALDIGLAALAAAVWYVRPQEIAAPLTLLGVGWILRWAVYGVPTRATSLDLPLLFFLASAFAASIIGYNQDARWQAGVAPWVWAWDKYWAIVAAVGLYYAIANVRRVGDLWTTGGAVALVGAALAVYFILTNDWSEGAKLSGLTQLGALLSGPLPDVSGRRLHPNVVGGIIAILFPFPLLRLWSGRRRPGSLAFWSFVTLLTVTGLILTASRGAWLAAALALLTWVVAIAMASPRVGRSAIRLALLGIGVVAIVTVAFAVPDTGTFGRLQVAPIAGFTGNGPGVVLSRFALWDGAIALGQDYAFTGAGLGAMPLVISAYDLLLPVFIVPHPHNLLLSVWVEQGFRGVLLLVWIFALSGLQAARCLRQSGHPAEGEAEHSRLLVETACASLGAMLLHGLVDDVPYSSRGIFLIFVPAAIISAISASRRMEPSAPFNWRVTVLAIVLCAGVALWQRESLQSMWFANVGALLQAQAELTTYESPERLPELVRRSADLEPAIQNFRRAIAVDPTNRTANQRLAMIALSRSEYEQAVFYAEAALKRDPRSDTSRLLVADAYLAVGRYEDAYRIWETIPNAAERVELTAAVRYDKLKDHPRGQAARELAARLRAEQAPRP